MDWQKQFHNITVPDTCCKKSFDIMPCTIVNAYQKGCMPKLLDLLDDKSVVLAAVGIGVALLQVNLLQRKICCQTNKPLLLLSFSAYWSCLRLLSIPCVQTKLWISLREIKLLPSSNILLNLLKKSNFIFICS